MPAHIGKPSGTRLTHHKAVITGPWHGHAKLQRFNRPLLAQYGSKRRKLGGGGKRQTGQLNLISQGTGWQNTLPGDMTSLHADYTIPCANMASATFTKPAILAPLT